MEGGVKTQTDSAHLKKSGNICYSNRLKSSRRSKRFCDFSVGRDGRVCSHPFVMILGNSQINSINLNSSQSKKVETFRKWQKNVIPDALNGSAEFGGGLSLGRVKFLYGNSDFTWKRAKNNRHNTNVKSKEYSYEQARHSLPTTDSEHYSTVETSHRQQHTSTIDCTETCRQMRLHGYAIFRQSRQGSKSSTLRSRILAIINILQHAQPRVAPLLPPKLDPTITDAFYHIDGADKRCSEMTDDDLQHAHKDLPNGWRIVVFKQGQTVVTSGHVPPSLLQQFTGSKAFIYVLEAWTAIIAPVLFQPLLTRPYIQLCENEASKQAILKGTGKHQPLNNTIGSRWTWNNRCQLHQIPDRVPSKANIADPFSRGDFTIANTHTHTDGVSSKHHTRYDYRGDSRSYRWLLICPYHRIFQYPWTGNISWKSQTSWTLVLDDGLDLRRDSPTTKENHEEQQLPGLISNHDRRSAESRTVSNQLHIEARSPTSERIVEKEGVRIQTETFVSNLCRLRPKWYCSVEDKHWTFFTSPTRLLFLLVFFPVSWIET